jgi:hypothetical protein
MKFVVTKKLRFWLLLIALCLQPLYANAENSCDCPDPPGGRITCEDHQVAICRVKDGKVYGECKTPPKSAREGIALRAWILSELLQTPIRPEEVERRPEYQRILAEGKYTNPRTREVIRFRLPRSW